MAAFLDKPILITGIEGFTGRYVADELLRHGYQLAGLSRTPVVGTGAEAVHVCDLLDAKAVSAVVEAVQPSAVIHLAAVAYVAHGDVEAIYRTNIVGTRNLLEALVKADVSPRAVLLASSANVYGNAQEGMLDESAKLAPANDYAVSKLAMEYVADLYRDRLPLIIARPFNYTGVGQSEIFLLPKIVAHLRRRAALIELGNLDVARDFSDVRVVAQCYRRLIETPAALGQTFNICSERTYTLDEVLQLGQVSESHTLEVRINPAFVRQNEVKILAGSRARLESAIGAIDDIPLAETLRWMLDSRACID